jgi:integrase/recombinase XerD
MPKISRCGQSSVLKEENLEALFAELNQPHRLIFQICYYTAARIGEVLQLRTDDLVDDRILYRAPNTKTKTSRCVIIAPPLAEILAAAELPTEGYLFPGRIEGHHITAQAADQALRRTCDYLGFKGISTHTFRRSVLTMMHFEKGISLRTLQQITKHQDLGNLARYLNVDQQDADDAMRSVWV